MDVALLFPPDHLLHWFMGEVWMEHKQETGFKLAVDTNGDSLPGDRL